MKRFWLLFVALNVYANQLSAQQQNLKLFSVGTVSPDAASIQKFGNIPVNTANGIPGIGIPFYEIKVGRISIPISLDYHAGGIRVDEVASSVGLGWALNCGGTISRNMIGLPDEMGSVGYLAAPSFASIQASPQNYDQFYTDVVDGARDNQPDEFSFNVAGLNGKFIFKQDGTVFQMPVSENKIEKYFDGNGVMKFKITDAQGIVYLFESTERYKPGDLTFLNQFQPYNNVWHLSKIIDQNIADTVYFNYDAACSPNSYESKISWSYKIGTYAYCDAASPGSPCQAGYIGETDGFQQTQQFNSFTPIYLSNIIWRGGKIIFNNACDRLDRQYEKRVSSIVLYSEVNNVQTQVKKLNLYHSYFTSTQGVSYNTISIPDATNGNNYRLRLDSVKFVANDPMLTETYKLSYDNTEMPKRESCAQDLWGFNNGQWSNPYLIASRLVEQGYNKAGIFVHTYKTIGGGNRDANATFMKACSLTSIEYPTGGKTVFEMEPHQYIANGPVTIAENNTCSTQGTINTTCTTTFTAASSWTNTRLSYFFSSYNYAGVSNRPNATITDQTTGSVVSQLSSNIDANQSQSLNGMSFSLTAGHTYVITVNIYTTTASAVSAWVRVDWDKVIANSQIKSEAGLRVKTISSYNIDGSLLSQELYKYGANESGIGTLLTPYTFFSMNSETTTSRANCPNPTQGVACDGSKCKYTIAYPAVTYYAGSMYSQSQMAGSPVVYDTVRKYQLDFIGQKSNGKTEFVYQIFTDQNGIPGPDILDVGMQLISNSWRNGRILNNTVYKSDGIGGYIKQEVKNYNYLFSRQAAQTCLKIKPQYIDASTRCTALSYAGNEVNISFYPLETGNYLLTGVTTTSYDMAARTATSSETYSYTDITHLQPTTKQIQNSKGQPIVETLKYPNDFKAAGNVYEKMVNRNIITPLIQDIRQVNGTQTLMSKSNYLDWQNNSKLLLPQILQLQVNANTVEDRIFFNGFDSYGNILEQQKKNDVKESYIWDYKSTVPIARVTNASQNEIAYTSFEADGKGSWVYTGTPASSTTAPTGKKAFTIVSASNNITKNGLSATGIYIVSYWRKSGTTTVNGGAPTTGKVINGWTYCEHKITNPSGGLITVSGTNGIIDELRLYPSTAQMTTYTFEPLVGATSICDVNNKIIYYEYDGLQRLILIRDQDRNIEKKICYNYAGQQENCVQYFSIDKSGTYTRDDCGQGYTGGTATVSVPAGMFSSWISQSDANQQATIYAQNQANATATCIPQNITITLRNNAGASGYRAVFTKNGVDNQFMFPSSGATNFTLPAGLYTVSIAPTGGGTSHSFNLSSGPTNLTQNGISASFGNVSITTTCTLTIN